MKLINKSTRNYIACDIILEAGKVLEVKDEKVIKLFLKQENVEEYIDQEDIKKLKEEIKQLKEEKNTQTKNNKNKKNK